jgi:hypothetical protein
MDTCQEIEIQSNSEATCSLRFYAFFVARMVQGIVFIGQDSVYVEVVK